MGKRHDRAQEIEAVRALSRVSRVLERASGQLNLAHYRVLSAIGSGDDRASRVAARLALGRPTVSAAVDSLVQRGLLAREEVRDDRRAASLQLTATGRVVLDEAESEMLASLADLCARVPDGAQLLESLVWLGQAVDERLAERDAETAPTSPS